ncbi:AgrD family cyclic lactone autoinducer peptide [Alkaliphilus metalliredigens]|nr:cyclic lactone autoinducer peptide [Alkaliphilus metalliredigens]
MKNNHSIFKVVLFSFASMFVLASDMIALSGSIVLWGEPKCPKNLLK